MESQLGAFLRASPDAAPDLYKRAPTYRRRYLGIVVDGQRRIEIEAFCDVPDTLSLSQHLVVFDGGDCVLYVEYDLTRGVFLSFATNGYG